MRHKEELQSDWIARAKNYGLPDMKAVPYVSFQRDWYSLCIKMLFMLAIKQGLKAISWKPGYMHQVRAAGETPGLVNFYDKQIPRFIKKLTKPYGMTIEKTKIPTKTWDLHVIKFCSPDGCTYAVDSLSEDFYIKSKMTQTEAIRAVQRHSRSIMLEVPVVYISDEFKRLVQGGGLGFYGSC